MNKAEKRKEKFNLLKALCDLDLFMLARDAKEDNDLEFLKAINDELRKREKYNLIVE